MNEQEFAVKLDDMCRELPTSMAPRRDLWPDIQARLEGAAAPDVAIPQVEKVWPFAAGIAATALVALMTILIARSVTDSRPQIVQTPGPAPILVIEPQWIPEVRRTRNAYESDYIAGLERLAPATRVVVEQNLIQIQQSLADIQAALASDPGNLSLHRLLATTYQQELNLITRIGALQPTESEL